MALITLSIIAIVITGLAYVQPSINLFPPRSSPAAAANSAYRVAQVDFISPTEGWVVVDFASGDYALIHTVDGGGSWTLVLTAPSKGHPTFVKFFDDDVGLVASLGTQPALRRTSDGGRTWTTRQVTTARATALSWSFIDSDNGWLLAASYVASGGQAPARLFRTDDGGLSWVDLGIPVVGTDQGFQVQFSYLTTGWLTTASSGPYAYHTVDFGATWSRESLPVPDVSSPGGGQFFVAVRPTIGLGAVASVIYFPAIRGRHGQGGAIQSYPPLTVRAFDGGRPDTYFYSTVLDQLTTGSVAVEPPNQTQLVTTDGGRTWTALALPDSSGAVGYSDASHAWWIGNGSLASSADGGATWSEPIEIGAADPLSGSLDVLDRAHAWFTGQSGSRPTLERTDDAGAHWAPVTLPQLDDRPSTT